MILLKACLVLSILFVQVKTSKICGTEEIENEKLCCGDTVIKSEDLCCAGVPISDASQCCEGEYMAVNNPECKTRMSKQVPQQFLDVIQNPMFKLANDTATTSYPDESTTDYPVESTTEYPVESTTEYPVESTTEFPIESTTEYPMESTTTISVAELISQLNNLLNVDLTSLSDSDLSDYTKNLAGNLKNLFSSNDTSANATAQAFNQVLNALNSLTSASSISASALNSIMNVFGTMLSQSSSFFNNLDTSSSSGQTSGSVRLIGLMETIFSKVSFNTTLSINSTGFNAYGAAGTLLLNGISQDVSAKKRSAGSSSIDVLFDSTAVNASIAASADFRVFAMFFDSSSSVVQSIFKATGLCSNKLISQRMVVITSSNQMSAVNGNLLDLSFAQDDNVTSLNLVDCQYTQFFEIQCVYLDTTSGKLSSSGCTHSYNNNLHRCQCSHLTPFALVAGGLSATGSSYSNWNSIVQYATTVSGACVFIICALISIIILLVNVCLYGKNANHDSEISNIHQFFGLFIVFLVNQIILNCFYIVFGSLNYNLTNVTLCKLTGVFLHYFFLTSFGIIFAMAILRFAKQFNVLNGPLFNYLASVFIYLSFGALLLLTILLPDGNNSGILKYVSSGGKCWLNDLFVLFAAVPSGIMFLASLLLCLLALSHTKAKNADSESNYLQIFILCIAFLTVFIWVFAFLVMIPTDISFLSAIFTIVYCVFSIFLGVFLIIVSVFLNNKTKRVRVAKSKQQLSENSRKQQAGSGIHNVSTNKPKSGRLSGSSRAMTPISD